MRNARPTGPIRNMKLLDLKLPGKLSSTCNSTIPEQANVIICCDPWVRMSKFLPAGMIPQPYLQNTAPSMVSRRWAYFLAICLD